MDDLLPPELAIDIFLRLPLDSIIQLRQVCKTWRRLLRDTHFVNTHLRRQFQQQQIRQHRLDDDNDLYNKVVGSTSFNNGGGGGGGGGGASKVSFIFLGGPFIKILGRRCGFLQYGEYDCNECFHYKTLKKTNINVLPRHSLVIIGSCNGLICFSEVIISYTSRSMNETVRIINPITGEQVTLPNFINNNTITTSSYKNGNYSYVRMVFGFGYLPSTNQYKVVRITYSNTYSPGDVGQVEVYTLGGRDGWRNKGEITAYLLPPDEIGYQLPGVLADGALHWLDYKNCNVVGFDLADEEFFMFPPPLKFQSSKLVPYLQVLGGCLCLVQQNEGISVDIWFLKNKKKNKNISNGTKEQDCERNGKFSIKLGGMSGDKCHPFAVTKSGEVILHIQNNLCLYDMKTATLKELKHSGRLCHDDIVQAIPHVNNFVSLKAFGESLVEMD